MKIGNHNLAVSGRIVKIARLSGDGYEYLDDPAQFIEMIKSSREIKADLFTFCENIPVDRPKYGYYMEWDNFAAIPVDTYDNWWSRQINDKTRNLVRKSIKKGVVVKEAVYDDEFVRGIVNIYNESPIRQGKPFWHYGKSFDAVKMENASYPDRSCFLGAYFNEELIGFLKLVFNGSTATVMQILGMIQHRDKSTTNALINSAVKKCETSNIKYLIYAKHTYGKKGTDKLSSFKEHNGFLKYEYPRYFVPLNAYGNAFLRLNLHKDISEFIPEKVLQYILNIREKYYKQKYGIQ